MNINYRVREIFFNGHKDDIVFEFKEGYELISTFLSADAEVDPESYIEALDSVLNEESEYEELNGNVCGILIHKDKTKVIDCLAEDGMGNWCEIETTELRELIYIWCDEVKRFKEQNK
ncbi:hypothetical protein [Clostridium felsineum]|uniref:hypothetical protein n=1 Tax=Clostridium felsineum TaxID=36839 RepID=UPI00098C5ED9|nr:hypothetical protein [Clostridium felsineum]URZ04279.1 Antitoxin [Clostridium felsineum]